MQSIILQNLTKYGYQVRAVPYSHVKEIQETINSLHKEGSLAQGVYDEVLEYVDEQRILTQDRHVWDLEVQDLA